MRNEPKENHSNNYEHQNENRKKLKELEEGKL